MNWTIGKTYKDQRGIGYVIVAVTPKGNLIGYNVNNELVARWNSDGKKDSIPSRYDLVNDDPTREERRFAHDLGAIVFFSPGSPLAKAYMTGDFSQVCLEASKEKFDKVIALIREIKGSAK